MRELHQEVQRVMNSNRFGSVARAYAWNDSVLLLAYVDEDRQYEDAIRDIDRIKHGIDSLRENCAVAVKGASVPTARRSGRVVGWTVRVYRGIKLCHGKLP